MTVTRLRDPFATTRQRATSSLDGVELIGLAVAAALLPVRTINLDHRHRRSREMTCKAGPIGAGALDPDTLDRAEPSHPRRQHPCPSARRRERLDTQQTAVHVDHRGDVHIAMRVDPTHNQTR